MHVNKIAEEILNEEKNPTSISQENIDETLEVAGVIREKLNSLLSEVDIAIDSLSSSSSPSVLDSKDDFKSLSLRLQQIKKKLMVV